MLNDKQKKYCEEYVIDFHQTNAAIRAGYSPKTARFSASELMVKQDIKDYILQLKMKLREKVDITKERVLEEYRRIAFSETKNYFDEFGNVKRVEDLDDEDSASIAEITQETDFLGNVRIKIKRWDKTKALEALGKHLGLFELDNDQKKTIINVNVDE